MLEFECEYRTHLKAHNIAVSRLQEENLKIKSKYRALKTQQQELMRASGGNASFLRFVSIATEPDFGRKSSVSQEPLANKDHQIISYDDFKHG